MPDRNEPIPTRVVLALHGHLPYVRHPDAKLPVQELWLHQNLMECYLPLMAMLEARIRKRLPCPLTLSLSPTLIIMLADQYYGERFLDYTETMLRLCEAPILRNDPALAGPALHLAAEITAMGDYYRSMGGDVIARMSGIAAEGGLSLITTAATHALLPAFRFEPELVSLQIGRGIEVYSRAFGRRPEGFWLPEMGYYAGLDRLLSEAGVRYTFLDTHGAYGAGPPGEASIFQPASSESGLTIFFRDRVLSDAIWARDGGYPGDPWYREFHADAAYLLSGDELARAGAERGPLGLKLCRVTGGDAAKAPYDPAAAVRRAEVHAADFIEKIEARARDVMALTGISPAFVLPFDMELFGHWWREGVHFLGAFLELADRAGGIVPVLPGSYTGDECPAVIAPAESSWGRGGRFSTWLNPECLRDYERMGNLYRRIRRLGMHTVSGAAALGELMLAQSSDWSFFISWESFRDYGRERLEDHLGAAERIISSGETGRDDRGFINERRRRYPLFKAI